MYLKDGLLREASGADSEDLETYLILSLPQENHWKEMRLYRINQAVCHKEIETHGEAHCRILAFTQQSCLDLSFLAQILLKSEKDPL